MYSGANPPSVAHVRNISSQHVDCLLPSSESLLSDTSFHINVKAKLIDLFLYA